MSKFICGICIATSAFLGTIVIIGAVAAPAAASPSCMSMDEARKAFPHDHIYWHGPKHCWDNMAKRRDQQAAAKAEPPARQARADEVDEPNVVDETKSAASETPSAPLTVPPIAFVGSDPTRSLFWPVYNAPARAQPSEPPAPPIAAQSVVDRDDIVIGAPNAKPGSADYLLSHCCWPPSSPDPKRDAGVLRNMIIASTGASGVAIGLWLLVNRRRREVRVRWS